MSSASSSPSRCDRLRAWGRRAWRVFFLAAKMAIAIPLSPLLLVDVILRRLAGRPSDLPIGIPSRAEMRALEPAIARGNPDALRRWLRGAFFWELIGRHNVPASEAAEQADQLAEQANQPDGYNVTIENV